MSCLEFTVTLAQWLIDNYLFLDLHETLCMATSLSSAVASATDLWMLSVGMLTPVNYVSPLEILA